MAAVRRGPRLAVGVRRPRGLPLVDHQVDRHLAFQAADVAVAEVVAQLVHLQAKLSLASALLVAWDLSSNVYVKSPDSFTHSLAHQRLAQPRIC